MNHSKADALENYRNAWKSKEIREEMVADDIEFFAPMKVFKGKSAVISAFQNWFLMIRDVSDYFYIINEDQACMLSKVILHNSDGTEYALWENDYFEFNEQNQISLYRPIFDSGEATFKLMGFDIASRCADARKIADENSCDIKFKPPNEILDIFNNDNGLELSDHCTMQWPFFTWSGKQSVQDALDRLKSCCSDKQIIFSHTNTDFSKLVILYGLSMTSKPMLWCSVWIDINNSKVKNIRFVFDSFEYFKDKDTINIFGFEKVLESSNEDSIIQNDYEATLIKNAILKFFMEKYNIPLQDTPIANRRLNSAVENTKII